MGSWIERFPELFAPGHWAWGELDVEFTLERPPEHLVSNVHLIARCGGRVVVCANDLGWRFLPGGTREPDESVRATAARELREEAGASLQGDLTWIGAYRARHRRPQPYRPHLPHPIGYWLYATADVWVDGSPTNPVDGEQVTEVRLLPPVEAADYLAQFDSTSAELVRLAHAMGHV